MRALVVSGTHKDRLKMKWEERTRSPISSQSTLLFVAVSRAMMI